jgi:putative transposase
LLKKTFKAVQTRHPFTIDAIVLLPDHLHCLWTLPPGDSDFSTRWMLIKSTFTRTCYDPLQTERRQSEILKREQNLWQRRFWEHQIRDDEDMIRHADYIHYNPVKHGLVGSPHAWEYSSLHRCVREGIYPPDWGVSQPVTFDGAIGNE